MSSLPLLTAVAPDIYKVHIPLPFALRIVNCYLLRGPAGWTLVDTGLNTSRARSAWRQALNELRVQPRHIERIVLTHTHPDHFGLSGWFYDLIVADGAPAPRIFLSAREDELARLVWQDSEVISTAYGDFWRKCALPDSLTTEIIRSSRATRDRTLPHRLDHTILEPGDPIRLGPRRMQPILAPGHSDGQLMFYDEADQLLLSGDHVLLKITPNISVWPHSDPNPLAAYLGSLAALSALPVERALPGHYGVIRDFHGRIAEIAAHHEQRLDETVAALTEPATVYTVSRRLFDHERLSIHEMRFAATETLAHLDYLVHSGVVRCEPASAVWRYERA